MAKKSLNNMFDKFETKEVSQSTENVPEVLKTTETAATPTEYSQLVKDTLSKSYDAKYNRPTVNDTHTRTTFLLRNDLAERLNKLSEGKRGYKTEFLNTAIAQLLDIIEND